MNGLIKVLLILLGLAALGVGGIMAYTSWTFRGYREAEQIEPIVREIALQIHESVSNRQPLPASAGELFSILSEEKRQKIQRYRFRWEPRSDPVLLIKINDRFGFEVDASGNRSWMNSQLLEKHFSN